MSDTQLATGGNVKTARDPGQPAHRTKLTDILPLLAAVIITIMAGATLIISVVMVISALTQATDTQIDSQKAEIARVEQAVPVAGSAADKIAIFKSVTNVATGLAAGHDLTYMLRHKADYLVSSVYGQPDIKPATCAAAEPGAYVVYITTRHLDDSGTYIAYRSATGDYVAGDYTNAGMIPDLLC